MAHILLIEPDRVLAQTYLQALEQAGHSVVPCAGAQAAILAADQKRPDVILLELQLIEHSGIEFLYELRSYTEWQEIPVLVQTHVPAGEFAANWQMLQRELGVAGYLYKPLTPLKDMLRHVNEAVATAA